MFLRTLSSFAQAGKLQQFLGQVTNQYVVSSGIRLLYSAEALGLDGYKNSREKTALQFQDLKDKFHQKMTEFSDPASNNMVFTEDLKQMLHLAEEKDLELVKQMIIKFNSQNKELRFGAYTFGPVIMRLYHHLNQPEDALELFLHEDFKSFFAQNNSYQVLMDLLYNNGRYEDVVKVFDIVEARQNQGTRYPRSVVMLYVAALYKMNTPESLERVVTLYRKLTAVGHTHVRRAVCFAAAIAVNQGQYNQAIELLALIPGAGTYVTVKCIKLLAMSKIGRYEDVLNLLYGVLNVDVPEARLRNVKQTILSDVMERLVADFQEVDNVEAKAKFSKLCNQLREFNHVSTHTLDDLLTSEIKENQNPGGPDQMTRSRYRSDNRSGSYGQNDRNYTRRPGLRDLQ
ncbi:hypothetical protein M8J76_014154 [Diaphorina citri]|nr:hypothetical protein M8J75_002029 [Diaphorina citri]KAI5745781.1 hypothetical protein M8J76_014154 [Diaphorina citri]